jgi:hypothetical protein
MAAAEVEEQQEMQEPEGLVEVETEGRTMRRQRMELMDSAVEEEGRGQAREPGQRHTEEPEEVALLFFLFQHQGTAEQQQDHQP